MKKNYKVGDRIFLEDWNDKEIFDCVVTAVEPREYEYNGKVHKFNMLHTGSHTMTEDYNCISERDPRVIEYKKTHTDPRKFVKKFQKFLTDNKFDIKSYSIQDYLLDLLS